MSSAMPCSKAAGPRLARPRPIAMSRKPAPPNWSRWRRSRPPSVRRQAVPGPPSRKDALDDCLRLLLDAAQVVAFLEALRVELGRGGAGSSGPERLRGWGALPDGVRRLRRGGHRAHGPAEGLGARLRNVNLTSRVARASLGPGHAARPGRSPPQEEERMKIHPLHDRLLVERLEEKEVKKGGIIIPDTAKEKPQEAKVIAVGNGKVTDEGKNLFGKYSGSEVKIDDKEYLIMREEDVLAILE